jgi:hypothetical protein
MYVCMCVFIYVCMYLASVLLDCYDNFVMCVG